MTARLTNIDLATVNVINTASETEIVSLVQPAYGMAAGRAVRLTVAGQLFNNSGGADTATFKVKLGTTTVLTSSAISITASASKRIWRLIADIGCETDDLQRVTAHLSLSEPTSDNFPLSDWSTDGATGVGYGTATEDGTGTVDVSVSVTLGSADADLWVVKRMGLLEQLGQIPGWFGTDTPAFRAVGVGVNLPQASAVIT
jgi:hypothetical protein